jgi:hypothetical protein
MPARYIASSESSLPRLVNNFKKIIDGTTQNSPYVGNCRYIVFVMRFMQDMLKNDHWE